MASTRRLRARSQRSTALASGGFLLRPKDIRADHNGNGRSALALPPRPESPFDMGADRELLSIQADLLIRPLARKIDSNNRLLRIISDTAEIERLRKAYGKNALPRIVQVNGTDALADELIRPVKSKRAYLITNLGTWTLRPCPSNIVLASASRGAGTYNSSSVFCGPYEDLHAFADVTVNGGGGTLTVALQTRMPSTGNWATAQTNIFAGGATAGVTYYKYLGRDGTFREVRLQAVVGVAAITFSTELNPKRLFAMGGSPLGNYCTVHLGSGPDVTNLFGYPLLAGQSIIVFLEENAGLFGITANSEVPSENTDLRILELQ